MKAELLNYHRDELAVAQGMKRNPHARGLEEYYEKREAFHRRAVEWLETGCLDGQFMKAWLAHQCPNAPIVPPAVDGGGGDPP